jgi:hypothetical protein
MLAVQAYGCASRRKLEALATLAQGFPSEAPIK